MKNYRSSLTFVRFDLRCHELLPFVQNVFQTFLGYPFTYFNGGWLGSFQMKSYRSGLTFDRVIRNLYSSNIIYDTRVNAKTTLYPFNSALKLDIHGTAQCTTSKVMHYRYVYILL